jgi:hypothetical protein
MDRPQGDRPATRPRGAADRILSRGGARCRSRRSDRAQANLEGVASLTAKKRPRRSGVRAGAVSLWHRLARRRWLGRQIEISRHSQRGNVSVVQPRHGLILGSATKAPEGRGTAFSASAFPAPAVLEAGANSPSQRGASRGLARAFTAAGGSPSRPRSIRHRLGGRG